MLYLFFYLQKIIHSFINNLIEKKRLNHSLCCKFEIEAAHQVAHDYYRTERMLCFKVESVVSTFAEHEGLFSRILCIDQNHIFHWKHCCLTSKIQLVWLCLFVKIRLFTDVFSYFSIAFVIPLKIQAFQGIKGSISVIISI